MLRQYNKECAVDIRELLIFTVQNNGSDLHVSAGVAPRIRVDGELRQLDLPVMDEDATSKLIYSIMSDQQRKHFEEFYEVDFSFELKDIARFRANVFRQERGIAGAFRIIPLKIVTIDDLGLPDLFKNLICKPRGLVLITGPAGSGKSTTLAALINYANEHLHKHIITIEDPIEYLHQSKTCLINQREVHRDTLSFNEALRSALREDPDIILVGELRDIETIRLALTASETGHLVLGTLHTSSAAKTINRIIDVFPGEEKSLVRSILISSLAAVISQSLIKKIGGGRIGAFEIMLCNPAVCNLIREDKIPQIYSVIQTSNSLGMSTLDQSLKTLVANQMITKESARELAANPEGFI